MIAAALTAMLLAPTASVPPQDAAPQAIVSAELERTEREFRFVNRSDDWQWLLFGSHDYGPASRLRVAPGQTVVLPCTPAAVQSLVLEVVQLDSEGLISSGGVCLESLAYVEHGRAVFEETSIGLVTWVAAEGEALRARTSGTLLFFQSGGSHNEIVIDTPSILEVNVPVITSRPAGNNNPIKRVPLPPA